MIVEKKCWPSFFNRILKGDKTVDVRLGDFRPGARHFRMVLAEWDPKAKRETGRRAEVDAKVLSVADIFSFYTLRDLMTHRLVVLEYSKPRLVDKKKKKK